MLLILDQFFGGPDGEPLTHHFVSNERLQRRITNAENGLGVAGGEKALAKQGLYLRRKIQQAHRIGHRGAVFTDALCDVFLTHVEFPGEPRIGFGFLDGIQVLTLNVLDQGHLQDIAVGGLALDDRNLLQAELFGGTEAALAGD